MKPYPKCKTLPKKPKRALLPQKPRAQVKTEERRVFSFKSKRQAMTFYIEVTEHLGLDAIRTTEANADGLWLVAVRGMSIHP